MVFRSQCTRCNALFLRSCCRLPDNFSLSSIGPAALNYGVLHRMHIATFQVNMAGIIAEMWTVSFQTNKQYTFSRSFRWPRLADTGVWNIGRVQ